MAGIISSQMQFKNYKTFNYTLAGRPLCIETGKLAGLANGSVMVRYGDKLNVVVVDYTSQNGATVKVTYSFR